MSLSNLVRLLVKRDKRGDAILKDGKPLPTWIAPVALHFWKVDKPNAKLRGCSTPEELLWRETAARLTLDAIGFTSVANKSKQERVKAMAEAQAAFRYDPESVMLIFAAAGVDFRPVLDAVLEIIDKRDLFNGSEEVSEGSG